MPSPDETRQSGLALVGCSGWYYQHWRGRFYPDALPSRQWLSFYSTVFRTVEINATFYRTPRESTVDGWHSHVSDEFVFSVKGGRLVTHVLRLRNAGQHVEAFCESIAGLKDKLGPILWQLPPGFRRDDERLQQFLSVLPRGMRHAIEFREESWWHPAVYSLLEAHRIAICLVDMPGFRSPVMATTDFVYVRFHGCGSLYSGSYDDATLSDWTAALRRDVHPARSLYAYFNNDAEARATSDALAFRQLLASA